MLCDDDCHFFLAEKELSEVRWTPSDLQSFTIPVTTGGVEENIPAIFSNREPVSPGSIFRLKANNVYLGYLADILSVHTGHLYTHDREELTGTALEDRVKEILRNERIPVAIQRIHFPEQNDQVFIHNLRE